MPAKAKTSPVLIVFLVVFVLLSLILGVTTYLGFSGQAQYEQNAKKAKSEMDQWKATADWYEFLAISLKAYMGEELTAKDKEDLPALRRAFGDGGGTLVTATGDTNKDASVKMVKELDTSMGWAQDTNKAVKSFKGELEARIKELIEAKDNWAKMKATHEEDQGKINNLDKELVDAKAGYLRDLNKAKDDYNKDLAKERVKVEALNKDKEELGKAKEDLLAQLADLKAASEKQVAKSNREIKGLHQSLDKQAIALGKQTNILDFDRPKGHVIAIGQSGRTISIDLGSADRLKPGITFSVYGVGPDGKPVAHDVYGPDGKPVIGADQKPEKEGKATLEVINVLGANVSQARVTWVREEGRDPIVRGDLLFNPAWDPNSHQHVAIAGVIDLTGEGHDDLPELMRTLEREGVVIDSYLDPKTVKVKGPGIDRQTDYLILGTKPNFPGSDVAREDDSKLRRQNQILKEMDQMQQKAIENGVTIVSLRKFLMMSGQRLPPGVGVDTATSGRSPFEGAPVGGGKEK